MKDPLAFFSAEWLARLFDMQVVVMIRHPAAFCSSLKILNWRSNFNDFTNQPLLMEKYLGSFADEMREFAKTERNIIDQGILVWNCFHTTIRSYKDRHPDWLFVKHEDLSSDPCERFRWLYKELNLEFTPAAQRIIEANTGEHNPAEKAPGRPFTRNSKKNITNWKTRLSTAEIDRIRRGTADVCASFYTSADW
jgi:hypothetical protein